MPNITFRNNFDNLLLTAGQAAVHSLYPNEYDYYAFQFELRNSNNNQITDLLILPVNPNNITIQERTIKDIQKTSSGIVNLINDSFVPIQYNISGSFGRKFRILLNKDVISGAAFGFTLFEGKELQLSPTIKSGYGTTKFLEQLLIKSQTLDENGNPYRLFFYNLAFNHVYLIQVDTHQYSQDKQTSNRIWQYNLSFTCIAPAENLIPDLSSSINQLINSSLINQAASGLGQSIRSTYRNVLNNQNLVDSLKSGFNTDALGFSRSSYVNQTARPDIIFNR